MKSVCYITVLLSLFAGAAWAKHPPRLFNEPIKLDDAGRPLYNQLERQEYERALRAKQMRHSRAPAVTPPPGPPPTLPGNTGRIPGGRQVISSPDHDPAVSGSAHIPTATGSTTTDGSTIDPTKVAPTPTQPSNTTEPAPGAPMPHNQDYGF